MTDEIPQNIMKLLKNYAKREIFSLLFDVEISDEDIHIHQNCPLYDQRLSTFEAHPPELSLHLKTDLAKTQMSLLSRYKSWVI